MGRESLKVKMENWMIAAAKAGGAMGDLRLVHADGSDAAKGERLVFDANVGGERLDVKAIESGTEYVGFDVEVKVELYSTNRNAEQVDSIFAALEAALISPKAIEFAEDLFKPLTFFPENMTSEDDRSKNTRVRSRTYPFIVGEIGLQFADSK